MNPLHKALDGRAMAIMGLLCLIWGFQQIAIKACAEDMAPTLQIGLRSGAAALLVALWMRWQRTPLRWRGALWRPGALVGALFGLEFILVAEGLRHTSASHMAVFLYTAPIFAALGLAFGGIAWVVLGRSSGAAQTELAAMLWGDFLGLLGGAAGGLAGITVVSGQPWLSPWWTARRSRRT